MSKVHIEFDTGNAAFGYGQGPEEAARALRIISDSLTAGCEAGNIRDSNGNTVGWWSAEFPKGEDE